MIPAITSRQNNYTPSIRPQNVHFGSTDFSYFYKNNKRMICYTNFFREDLPWKKFASIISKNFKNASKVNVINGACSDGSEAISLIMLLKENLSQNILHKIFPIKAFDFCDEMIINAKRGTIEVSDADIEKIKKHIPQKSKYMKESDYSPFDFYLKPTYTQTYKIMPNVLQEINFEQNDVFNVLRNLKDESNTIFMFRNALIHLGDQDAEKFAKLAGEKLKEGSLLIIGNTDKSTTGIDKYLKNQNFKEIATNIYKKIKPKTENPIFSRFKKLGTTINNFFK